LVAKVKEFQADLGVAWDADCDRVYFVDETGRYLDGDFIIALLAVNFLEKNPVSRPDPIVLYVGQLEEHKGLRVLMEAWHAVDANLGIVGSGELESEVETFTKERSGITFYGRRSPIEVRSLMARARLLVVPSLCYENAPTVIMEALSLGTPVVASNIGGIPELIREGEGVLVEPGNAEALREAITAELKKPLDREKIKQSATRFSLEVYKRQLEDIIGMVRTNDVKK